VEKRGKLMADGWSRTPAWPEAKSSLGSRKISGRVFQQNLNCKSSCRIHQIESDASAVNIFDGGTVHGGGV
jgi:hypothetical protein